MGRLYKAVFLNFENFLLQETGEVTQKTSRLGTQNSGVWKLEDPRINCEHNLATDRGSARFSETLYELT